MAGGVNVSTLAPSAHEPLGNSAWMLTVVEAALHADTCGVVNVTVVAEATTPETVSVERPDVPKPKPVEVGAVIVRSTGSPTVPKPVPFSVTAVGVSAATGVPVT